MENAKSEQKIEISIQGLHSNKGKYTDLEGFTTRNHPTSTTKRTAQVLIQRYKACYSQKGVIQIHSGRKRLVVRRYGWIQNIANPLLAPAPLPDTFCNKNNASSAEATKTQRTGPADSKGFRHGFHYQPARYRTARMDKPREAKSSIWRIASVCAARKHSSST